MCRSADALTAFIGAGEGLRTSRANATGSNGGLTVGRSFSSESSTSPSPDSARESLETRGLSGLFGFVRHGSRSSNQPVIERSAPPLVFLTLRHVFATTPLNMRCVRESPSISRLHRGDVALADGRARLRRRWRAPSRSRRGRSRSRRRSARPAGRAARSRRRAARPPAWRPRTPRSSAARPCSPWRPPSSFLISSRVRPLDAVTSIDCSLPGLEVLRAGR